MHRLCQRLRKRRAVNARNPITVILHVRSPWAHKKAPGDYAVGYGKPPVHTRFRKGMSGNAGGRAAGRPAKAPLERIKTLALREAYRAIAVKGGGVTATLPAIRAVLRRQLALAAKGNGPAQRAAPPTSSFEKKRLWRARLCAKWVYTLGRLKGPRSSIPATGGEKR